MAVSGSPLTSEYKKTIVCVKKYFDRTKSDTKEKSSGSVEKTAHALDVGVATVKRIMADYIETQNYWMLNHFVEGILLGL